jgi:hypothetical protein
MLSYLHSSADALSLLFALVALGCLIAAGVSAFRGAWIACLCLLAVAIVTAAIAFG